MLVVEVVVLLLLLLLLVPLCKMALYTEATVTKLHTTPMRLAAAAFLGIRAEQPADRGIKILALGFGFRVQGSEAAIDDLIEPEEWQKPVSEPWASPIPPTFISSSSQYFLRTKRQSKWFRV